MPGQPTEMKNSPSRRLAAIMFTDIVGYTAMMHDNEVAAAVVRKRHREIFKKEHQRCQGEVIQYYGDGTLSIFKSAVEAVECAIAMQQEFQVGNVVPLRIGLHLGDIVLDENDVYGDGVNLASRIESMGIPGCVLISDKINYAIKNHHTIETQSLGQYEFKNIKDPVEVFSISNKGIVVPNRSQLKGKLKEKTKSIAVLPFVNISSDPENEYFSDGISEEILNALVKVAGLQVTARTSSFSFKGKNMDVREIGRQLGVGHLLEGSVRKSGNRVRITAQLVSSVDGYHFFSETYDRDLEDIFAVQDEIAQKITNRLREHLSEVEHRQQLVKVPTSNMKAYDVYLKGLYFFNQWGEEAFGKAIPYFEKAIEMQHDFALPHSKIAISYLFQTYGGKLTWKEAYEKAIVHINRTKELNDVSPEGYFAQFVFQIFFKWDWKEALEVTKKGLALFPNYASLYHAVSTLYFITGDLKKGIIAHQKGVSLDPLSMQMVLYMGILYLWVGDYKQARIFLNKVLEMVPNHRTVLEYKGWMLAMEQQYDDALVLFEQLEPPIGYRLHRSTCLAWVYYKKGQIEKAKKYLEEVKILQAQKEGVNLTFDLVIMYLVFDNIDLAFHYLEKAIQNKIGDVMMFVSDPFLAPLHNDPRFEKMKALIGEVPAFDLEDFWD